jgi:endonuclease/exonuclease/phosphatase family metal-dependent hydrolase
MKLIQPVLLLAISLVVAMQPLSAQTIRVATYNIKYDNTRDAVNNWSRRKGEVVGLIKYHGFELFGTQEGLHHQLEDMKKGLQGFEYVGVARDDGKQQGEYSAFFYDTNTFNLLQSGTFWLSETPGKPSKSWDAALPRICTWGELEHKSSGKKFFVFNAHFDHVGVKAREESAKVIMRKAESLAPDGHVIMMGDFNFEPDAQPYAVITEKMEDSFIKTSTAPYGPEGTFNGFNWERAPDRRIDFIFTKGPWKTEAYATISDSNNMLYPSDHFPVVVDLIFDGVER